MGCAPYCTRHDAPRYRHTNCNCRWTSAHQRTSSWVTVATRRARARSTTRKKRCARLKHCLPIAASPLMGMGPPRRHVITVVGSRPAAMLRFHLVAGRLLTLCLSMVCDAGAATCCARRGLRTASRASGTASWRSLMPPPRTSRGIGTRTHLAARQQTRSVRRHQRSLAPLEKSSAFHC